MSSLIHGVPFATPMLPQPALPSCSSSEYSDSDEDSEAPRRGRKSTGGRGGGRGSAAASHHGQQRPGSQAGYPQVGPGWMAALRASVLPKLPGANGLLLQCGCQNVASLYASMPLFFTLAPSLALHLAAWRSRWMRRWRRS